VLHLRIGVPVAGYACMMTAFVEVPETGGGHIVDGFGDGVACKRAVEEFLAFRGCRQINGLCRIRQK
jgi:hypothetical protein